MPDWLSIHEPVLVNTIGHCVGLVIFGTLLYFFVLNSRRSHVWSGVLPAVASALAIFWNLGCLVALGMTRTANAAVDPIMAASFSALSALPAVLLRIYLQSRYRPLWIAGYVVSASAIALHIADAVTGVPRLHSAALDVVIVGFGALTAVSVILDVSRKKRAAGSRLAAAMGLFLLAASFAHFGAEPADAGWMQEVILHHAGLPLALFVLLQDYRFFLLDAFLRFVVNGSFAVGAVLAAVGLVRSPQLAERLSRPFDAGVLFVGACLILTLFVWLRNRIQEFLTRVIFLRANVDEALDQLRQTARAARSETEYVAQAAELIARFFRASGFELRAGDCGNCGQFAAPAALVDPAVHGLPGWALAIVPLRFPAGDVRYVLMGPREGGRRYLSEDFAIMLRLAATVVEHAEQLRSVQMQKLLSQAELRALQAQIHPHFLFNSLTTLYGSIDRTNQEARRLVLDLSNVFRYLLRTERTFIDVAEELTIVRSYLEIEAMRLGSKLTTEIDVADAALRVRIPMLSIQPLVENAVRHGVAARSGPGFVQLCITVRQRAISVEVTNSGECETERLTGGDGIGLANVRRRLALCYGPEARFEAHAGPGVTRVGFTLPLQPAGELVAAAVT